MPSTSKTFTVDIVCDRQTVAAELTRAVLSTILFHRLFGSVAATSKEVMGVSYPGVENAEIAVLVEERGKEVVQQLRNGSKATVKVLFQEHKARKTSWFAKPQEMFWEVWRLRIYVNPEEKDIAGHLRKNLQTILQYAETHKEHIPPITSNDLSPFPFEIVVESR